MPDRDDETIASTVARWAEHDARHAIHQADHDVIAATEPVRWLIVNLFGRTATARDLFNACARLGGLMSAAGASPSLAANTIDNAIRALEDAGAPFDVDRTPPARASLLEGYVAAVRDGERSLASGLWEYPACTVPLADGSVAIACGYPSEDAEALSGWAARVVGRLVKGGTRRIVLSGPELATSEVASAAGLVGIEVISGRPSPGSEEEVPKRASWFRLPWRK